MVFMSIQKLRLCEVDNTGKMEKCRLTILNRLITEAQGNNSMLINILWHLCLDQNLIKSEYTTTLIEKILQTVKSKIIP